MEMSRVDSDQPMEAAEETKLEHQEIEAGENDGRLKPLIVHADIFEDSPLVFASSESREFEDYVNSRTFDDDWKATREAMDDWD